MKHFLSILILLNIMSVTSAELTSDNTKPEGNLKYRLIMCTGESPETDIKEIYIYAFEPKFNLSSRILIFYYGNAETFSDFFLTEEANDYKILEDGRYYLFNYNFILSHVSDDLELSEVEQFHEVILDNKNLKFKINGKFIGLSGIWEGDDFEWSAAGYCVEYPELETIDGNPMKYFNS